MLTIHLIYGAKGGVGTTVIATALALLLADKNDPVLLVDAAPGRDIQCTLGMPEHPHPEDLNELSIAATTGVNFAIAPAGRKTRGEAIAHTINSLADFHSAIVVDAGVAPTFAWQDDLEAHVEIIDVRVIRTLVVRNDLRSLRHAGQVVERFDQTVHMVNADDSLDSTDVSAVLRGNNFKGMSIVVDIDSAVARTIDAGLIAGRFPRPLEIVHNLDPGSGVRLAIEADITDNA